MQSLNLDNSDCYVHLRNSHQGPLKLLILFSIELKLDLRKENSLTVLLTTLWHEIFFAHTKNLCWVRLKSRCSFQTSPF